jgi:hypothetical protein
MPSNPELELKLRQLHAMEFILGSVIDRLGELSDFIAGSPADLQVLLQWQMDFSQQMIQLQELISEDIAKERLMESLSEVMSSSVNSQEND